MVEYTKSNIISLLFIIFIFAMLYLNYFQNIELKECKKSNLDVDMLKYENKELERTRYLLVKNFCETYNFSSGFIKDAPITTNLSLLCLDCDNSTCGDVKTFVLK